MGAGRRFAHKLILILAATLATLATAHSQDLIFSPSSGSGPSQFDQTQLPEKSAGTIKQDNDSTKWMRLPQVPFIDFYWDSFGTDFSRNIGSNSLKNPRDLRSTSGSANSNDNFLFGNSYLGVQTQKNLQSSWRTDCASDDECADYSGLPKSEPSKRTLKNLRKPFIGLSITRPLQ